MRLRESFPRKVKLRRHQLQKVPGKCRQEPCATGSQGPARGLAPGRLSACVRNGGRGQGRLWGGNNAKPANKDEGVKTGSTRGALADFRSFAFLHSHSYLAHERATLPSRSEPSRDSRRAVLSSKSCSAPQRLTEQLPCTVATAAQDLVSTCGFSSHLAKRPDSCTASVHQNSAPDPRAPMFPHISQKRKKARNSESSILTQKNHLPNSKQNRLFIFLVDQVLNQGPPFLLAAVV